MTFEDSENEFDEVNESENEFEGDGGQDSQSEGSNSGSDMDTIHNTDVIQNNSESEQEKEDESDAESDSKTANPSSKGAAIQAQLDTFDQLVDVRIRLQTLMTHYNYEKHPEFSPELVKIHNLLVNLQHELGSGPKKRKFEEGDDVEAWIEATDANYADWNEKFYSSQFDTLKYWESKVTVEDVKKFKVIDTSVVTQLKNLEKEKPRLLKKSRKSTDATDMVVEL